MYLYKGIKKSKNWIAYSERRYKSMKNKTTAYDQAFKEQVVQYRLDHPQTSYTKASRKFV